MQVTAAKSDLQLGVLELVGRCEDLFENRRFIGGWKRHELKKLKDDRMSNDLILLKKTDGDCETVLFYEIRSQSPRDAVFQFIGKPSKQELQRYLQQKSMTLGNEM